jgi:hypothetical protein
MLLAIMAIYYDVGSPDIAIAEAIFYRARIRYVAICDLRWMQCNLKLVRVIHVYSADVGTGTSTLSQESNLTATRSFAIATLTMAIALFVFKPLMMLKSKVTIRVKRQTRSTVERQSRTRIWGDDDMAESHVPDGQYEQVYMIMIMILSRLYTTYKVHTSSIHLRTAIFIDQCNPLSPVVAI